MLLVSSFVSCVKEKQINAKPPVAAIETKIDTVLGHERNDNYFWLRNRGDSSVLAYLEAENEYTDAVMASTKKLQIKLYEEMVARIKETDLSVPVKDGEFFYYSRTEEGKQYDIYCRKHGSLEAQEEILLDLNQLAEGKDYMDLSTYEVSPNHQMLAYSLDTAGNENYTLFFKNLTNGEILSESIPNTGNAAWSTDNKTIFYTVEDDTHRPYQLFRHTIFNSTDKDDLVYQEDDQAFFLWVNLSKSEKYIFVHLGSQVTSEVRYLDAAKPKSDLRVIQPRQQDVEYDVDHHSDWFYITTNYNAKNFKLMKTPVTKPGMDNWIEVIPAADTAMITGIEMFNNFMVVYERVNGLQQILVRDLSSSSDHYVDFPEPVYTVNGGDNPDFNSDILRFSYMSLVTPRSVYDYNMKTNERELKKQTEVLGGYDPELYQSERVFAKADDGALIPISLVYKKGIKKNGKNPLYLYGYGAYGISMDPYFSSRRLSLLDRGFIYAIAHIRGGGEMGRQWYEDGKYLNKKNTFTDFIACGDYLVSEKYTSHDKMAISGASAGGLLIGAVVNIRPDLANVAIADVPFVDVINTMRDESIPLTVVEYEEWGNPNLPEYYDYMNSYCPYDNVEAKEYPNMLITAGLNDPRVQYWEPAKWTAKLRATKTDNNMLLLKTNMGAGHGGASGRYDYLKEIALEYAFILKCLGMTD
ncbi:MAG: S9 family peptidase [bacterium]